MPTINKPKSVLFARVSSREQEETGYSLPSQEKLLEEYTQRKDFSITKKFSISESASGKSQRTIFREMMDYVKKNKIKVIVCEKVDRLTRNFKDAVCVNEWINEDPERQVHFVKENCILTKDSKSNEKFIWNIKVSVAQYYIDNLSEEVKKGQKEKISQGWLPTKPPLGYQTVGEKGHKIHILDKRTAPFLKKAFELYATCTYSLHQLSKVMSEEGALSSLGNKITKSRWAELFSDPFYIGKIRWKGEIYNGRQEPLISKDLFQLVQDVLKSKATPKYRKHFFLFKGLIKCPNCDGRITWEQKKGHEYGHCNYYKFCQKRTYVRQEKVEEQILSYLDQITIENPRLVEWVQKALKESHQDEIAYHQTTQTEINHRSEQIQKRLDMLYDDKLDGKITLEFYETKFKQYSEQKEEILNSLQSHSEAQSKYFELGVNVLEISKGAKELYLKNTIEKRRSLLSLVFSSLKLNEEKLEIQYTKPFEIIFQRNKEIKSSKIPQTLEMPVEILEPAFLEQKRAFQPKFASVLRGQDSNLQPSR